MHTHFASFPKSATLSGRGTFTRIMDHRVREHADVFAVHAAPNGTAKSRLGISIGRKVGNAVARNRIKRLVREAFRLSRADWPAAYDLVVVIRPHEKMMLDDYVKRLNAAVAKIHRRWVGKAK
jgi:ribonuclease P protein component